MTASHYFFVDAETDGLYGAFLSAAALVTDGAGRELDRFYGALSPDRAAVSDPWVRENVLPSLGRAEVFFETEAQLLEAFWAFWLRWREGCVCAADVPVPVEARLLARCVEGDPETRTCLGPFPLLDLSTLLFSRGIDPKADRLSLSGLSLTRHDALDDVRMTAAVWRKLLGQPGDPPASGPPGGR